MEENKNRSPTPSLNSSPPPDTAPADMAAAGADSVAGEVSKATATGEESKATGSEPVVKRGRGRPRKTERSVTPPSPTLSLNSSPPPDTAPADMVAAGADSVTGEESKATATGEESKATATGEEAKATGSKPVVKRGRGRPRKTERSVTPPSPVFPAQPIASTAKPGMPHGTGKVKMVSSLGCLLEEPSGPNLTIHKVTVNPGENAVSKILSFFDERAPEDVFILSANGEVSSVFIHQSGALERYEGNFEILSLTGHCTYTMGAGGLQRENVTLTILLAKPNGHTFGGVIDSLTADTHIQIFMGVIKQLGSPEQSKKRNSSGSPKGDQDSAMGPPSASGSMPEATPA